jgi:molybdopterin converting factor small subunit
MPRTMARQLRVELTFLSTLQQVAGRSTLWLEVPPGASVDRLLALLRERHPQFQGVDMQTNVNGLPVTGRHVLAQGDGLFLLPPV